MPFEQITHRLTKFRARLKADGLDGFIVPHNDEFQSEFLPEDAERLAYLTGFTGSAGTAIVLMDRAILFVPGLYTLQAANQVSKADFALEHPLKLSPETWLEQNLTPGSRFGYDPWLHTPKQIDMLTESAGKAGARLIAAKENPVDAIWDHRPKPPAQPVHLHPVEFAGESCATKRALLAQKLAQDKIDAAVLTDTSSIAWLLNVRGNDIPYMPVVLSHAILHGDGTVDWFVDPAKRGNLHIDGVRVHACSEFLPMLNNFIGKRVLVSPSTVSGVFDHLRGGGAEIVQGPDPCVLPKSRKNKIELEGSKAAHLRDGAALCGFLAWFAAADKTGLTELAIAEKLEGFRKTSNLYRGPSFETIAGSGPHGAIIHYRPTRESDRPLDTNSLLLLDSGAQYQDGTTDITRTIGIGTPRHDMREIFTLVLKGHIALATARFPKDTAGVQLDVLARQFLWARGRNYDHSSGHTVGSYLGVHDAPGRVIGPRGDGIVLYPGMILSNEPGYYEADDYGIRFENLMVVRESENHDGFLEFETISLAPIDRACIIADMLSREERTWVNQYHLRVQQTLTPLVDAATAAWLKKVCAPL